MFVLGIDPGLTRCGYGGVVRAGSALVAATAGVLTTGADRPLAQRLAELHRGLSALIEEHRPAVVAVEQVFFQANARTAMSVGQASGLALAAAAASGCGVVQYTPNEVKLAVTGSGSATKVQVQHMVQRLLALDQPPRPPDAADALALALCHHAVAPLRARVTGARVTGARVTGARVWELG
ncbi:MAG: crossover junction endodeoxyribonuclease RuvC [Acidimicrobiales bacterium]